ncbi:MAG: acyloxyacyl hydrolase [Verrucomicrobia bacterium]|nr:acyloxyacyl hydrolase [Verrucomicrobiota bacterium]
MNKARAFAPEPSDFLPEPLMVKIVVPDAKLRIARLLAGLVIGLFLTVSKTHAEEPGVAPSFLTLAAGESANESPSRTLSLKSSQPGIWEHSVGEGFRKRVLHAGFSLGGAIGVKVLGSREAHDMALGTAHIGRVWSDVVGDEKWYRGNWDLMGELFGGRQLNPHKASVAGFTPALRYHFATGTRWIPFLEGGAGVSWTDIDDPDLATRFEFHLVGGGGLQWFCRENLAVTLNYRFAHLSNAGIRQPNIGLNTNALLLGLTWFF